MRMVLSVEILSNYENNLMPANRVHKFQNIFKLIIHSSIIGCDVFDCQNICWLHLNTIRKAMHGSWMS